MAARIAGVILPQDKHIRIALRSVFGIGAHRAESICKSCNIDPATKVRDLTEEVLKQLQDAVGQFAVEGDLRRTIAMNIKRLIDLRCFRGQRHRASLPVRGQRTKTNAKTRKRKSGRSKKVGDKR